MKSSLSAWFLFCLILGGSTLASSPFQDLEDSDSFSQLLNHSAATPRTLRLVSYPRHLAVVYDRYLANSENNFRRSSSYDRHSYRLSRYKNDELVPTGVFRTYGRGRAEVTRPGETVRVPNDLGRRNLQAHRGTVTVLDRDENDLKFNGQRGRCKECPVDQTVVASKGNSFVIMPEPCPSNPRMWNPHSGPRAGSKIREGVHVVRGTLGPKKKFCEYQYQVLVRRCEPLKAQEEDTRIDCTENDVWGSQCTFACGYEREPVGSTVLECMEDLKWSNPVPKCKSKMDCSTPKVKSNSKIWCQTANMTYVEGDFIPHGSTCRFRKNGRDVSINCKEGTWRISRKNKAHLQKKNKGKLQSTPEKNPNPCNPNPCQNGGTCLKPVTSKGPPICACRPQTQGVHCEMRECDYNICHNDGLCFFQNNEKSCYCLPEYDGEQCQNRSD